MSVPPTDEGLTRAVPPTPITPQVPVIPGAPPPEPAPPWPWPPWPPRPPAPPGSAALGCRQFVTMGNTIRAAMHTSLEHHQGQFYLTEGGCARLAAELRRSGIRVFRHGSALGCWMPSLLWVTTEEAWWAWGLGSPWRSRNPWVWPGGWLTPADTLPGVPDPWSGWVSLGAAQFAFCQAGCPQGGIAGVPWWKGTCALPGCPWLCRGCEAGWPYDEFGRHMVNPPLSTRWDCNRVKWLGSSPYAQAVGGSGVSHAGGMQPAALVRGRRSGVAALS